MLFAIVNPVFNVVLIAIPDAAIRGGHAWWIGAAVHGVFAILLTAASAMLLRRMQRREGAGPAPATESLVAGEPSAGKSRSKRRPEVGDNPVLWRELGQTLFPKRWQSRAAAIVLVGMLLASYAIFAANNVLDDEEAHIFLAVIFNGLTWLAVSVLAATAIAQETESDTWTLLLATPLKSRAIVLGKILGICRRMFWPMVLVAANFSLFAACGVVSWAAAFWAVWIIITFNTIWVATGTYLSLRLRRVTLAVVINLLIGIAIYAALPLLLLVLGEALAGTDNWAEGSGTWIPYVYLVAGLDAFIPDFESSRYAWLPTDTSSTSGVLLVVGLLAGAVHMLTSGIIVAWTIYRFDHIVGRAAQTQPLPPAGHSSYATDLSATN
jgi:ABC-type transport system involved in multi-copper enzyme maturation permease subunit